MVEQVNKVKLLAQAFENRKEGDVEPAFLERDPITIFDDICAL